MAISNFPTLPFIGQARAQFNTNVKNFLTHLQNVFINEMNTAITEVNSNATAAAQSAQAAAQSAQAAAQSAQAAEASTAIGSLDNFQGTWDSGTAYVVGESVLDNDTYWICLIDNTNSQPAVGNANWAEIPFISKSQLYFNSQL